MPGSMVRPVLPHGLTLLATTTSKSTTHNGATWTLTPIGTAIVNWSDGVWVVLPVLWNDTTGTAAPTWPPTMRVSLDAGGAPLAATTGAGAAGSCAWAGAGMRAASATATVANRNGRSFETVTLEMAM